MDGDADMAIVDVANQGIARSCPSNSLDEDVAGRHFVPDGNLVVCVDALVSLLIRTAHIRMCIQMVCHVEADMVYTFVVLDYDAKISID